MSTRDEDIIVGGSKEDACINSGVSFWRGGKNTQEVLIHLRKYLHNYPYIIDQRLLSGYLGTSSDRMYRPEFVSGNLTTHTLSWGVFPPDDIWIHGSSPVTEKTIARHRMNGLWQFASAATPAEISENNQPRALCRSRLWDERPVNLGDFLTL